MTKTWTIALGVTAVGSVGALLSVGGAAHGLVAPGGNTVIEERLEGDGGPAGPGSARGLEFRLSEGSGGQDAHERVRPGAAEPLGEAETKRVLDRLPPLLEEPTDRKDFALRESSLPPPRTGATVKLSFPPREEVAPPTAPAVALEVLRKLPAGDVPLAPHVSVTFSQPMVAVTAQEEAAKIQPVSISPIPPGRWRWVGTRTLLFEAEGRFPMATEYRVTVPAGTRSAQGASLGRAEAWTFRTPPLTLAQRWPEGGPVRRDTALFLAFDQRIEAKKVLAFLDARASQGPVPLRLANEKDLSADPGLRALARAAQPDRFLAVVPEKPFPAGSQVTVSVRAGAPSAEGPRLTEKPQDWSFTTYGPLKVEELQCGWGGECRPFTAWQARFNNPLDAKALRQDWVHVEPPLPGLKLSCSGSTLFIQGASKGRTTYRVTLRAGTQDVFGQTLGRDETRSITVGSAEPRVFGLNRELVVLDPAASKPVLAVRTINVPDLKVEAWRVEPEDWSAFLQAKRAPPDKPAPMPGRVVLSQVLKTQGAPDELSDVDVDLASAFPEGFGQAIVRIEPTVQPKDRWRRMRILAWVQATRIGLTAFADRQDLVAFVSSLADGQPLSGADVTVMPQGATRPTDAAGLVTLSLAGASRGSGLLVARRGRDVAILPENLYTWDRENPWRVAERRDRLAWYVADDRGLYRPGEEAKVKGWVRRIGGGPRGDVGLLDGTGREIRYVLRDSRGNEVTKGTVRTNALGGFDFSLKLPPSMSLGAASLVFESGTGLLGEQHLHHVRVEEFRRPEFEVKTAPAPGPYVVGGFTEVTAKASYYAGGGLPGADLTWRVTARPTRYSPPNRDDFVFGPWVPWWFHKPEPMEPSKVLTLTARTDGSGQHVLRIDFDTAKPARPTSLLAEATVMDVNRQAWTSGSALIVHPSSLYVGLRTERPFVQKGEPLVVKAIVTDADGVAVTGRGTAVIAERLDWEQRGGEWRETVAASEECAVTSGSEPVTCRFTPKEGGAYRIRAQVLDDKGRQNESELRVWVAGGKLPPRRNVEREEARLIPSKKEYAPGDVAEILVLAPFAPAEGVLTLRREGMVRTERFTMGSASHTLKVPIEEGFTPNVHVQVDLVGSQEREPEKKGAQAPRRPAFASGSLDLGVPPVKRNLKLAVTPREKRLEPGAATVLDVELRDADGRAVSGGEVAVIVADEAVLALTGYALPDPLTLFYPRRSGEVSDFDLRSYVVLARAEDLVPEAEAGDAEGAMPPPRSAPQPAGAMMRKMKGGGQALALQEEAAPEPIQMRSDFSALALFAASLPTDAKGHAEVALKLPDNLTRYRVMAVGVAGGQQFGRGESAVEARLPLMVRPSAPRFLNFGDHFELPVVVQNQTDAALPVQIAVRATNARLTAGAGRRLTVPPNDRVEVRFPVSAEQAGRARFQVGGVSGRFADAAEVSLPVWTPATTEAFATYGEVDRGAVAQPVTAPQDAVAQFGGLEVTTSSTALQALTDAMLYLQAYPFECSEQLASRILAVAALRDVLTAFKVEGLPTPEAMVAAVERDIARLRAMQNDDGGFSFWRRGDDPWPYLGVHVAHALERARNKGFQVPDDMWNRSRGYLAGIEGRIPKWYSEDSRRSLVAYALYVRLRMGDPDPGRARKLLAEAGVEKLPFEALGWILPVLSRDKGSATEVGAIRRHLANRVEETAGAAHFVVSYSDGAQVLLHSDRRADAVLLEALIADDPGSDLIPKLVAGLLGHRKAGRWGNTQENAFVLLALDRYFAAYEKTSPDFVARMWLGQRYAGEQAYRGRSTDRHLLEIPMGVLKEATGSQELLLSKEGPGRLYYRIGMRYAPKSLKLAPADYGFAVERAYEALDAKDDVRRDADGTWRIRAGARIRVKLSLVAPARRYHVALVDPLPAGLEPLNPALATTGSLPPSEDTDVTTIGAPGIGGPGRPGPHWWRWTRPWFEHQNLRDERVEAFTSLLWEGVYSYAYVARATTPGSFVVPPTKAEEMYAPETFGRGGSDRVVVE